MAEKLLQTRIVLKHDTLENWNKDTAVILKEGEIALAKVETNEKDPISGKLVKVPTYLIKVGDGSKKFSELNWVAAPAADVYDWAKKSEAEFTTWVKGLIDVSDIDLTNYVTTTSFAEYKTQVTEALDGKQAAGDYATKSEAQGYANAKDEAIQAAKKAGDDAQAAVDALTKDGGAVKANETAIAQLRTDVQNGTTIDSFADVETELAKYQLSGDYATKSEAQGYANAKDEAIAEAKKAGTDAQAAVDALTAENGAVTANATEIAAIKTNISTNYATKQNLTDAVGALTAEGGAVKANADAIAKLNGNDQVEGSVDYKIAQEVAKILNDNDASDIDTLNEIAAWITNDQTGVAKMNADIAAHQVKIDALEKVGSEKNTIVDVKVNGTKLDIAEDRSVNIELGDLASKDEVAESDLASALATKINGKVDTATFTPVSEQVEQNKTDIAALKTIEHHSHTNKAELDLIATGDKAKWDQAATDAVHTNRAVLDGITSDKVTAWDAAEQNAKDYAKKYADDNFDAKGAAAGVQSNLDALNTELKAIAKSGNVNDLVQTTGDVLVFDCGTSTKNV